MVNKWMLPTLWLLLPAASALAQSGAVSDSVWGYPIAQAAYRQATRSVAGLVSYPLANTGIISLAGHYEEGGLRTGQTPQQHRDITFETEGVRTLQRFRVYGRFTYQRSSQDSLSWSLMGVPDHDRPFYYAARKAGHFERQAYQVSGRVAYTLRPERLFIGAGATYLYNTAYRTEDPRPAVKNFSLVLQPEFAWQQGRHVTGIMPVWGYGYETNGITYMNDQYRNNFDKYPERRTWMMMGMGYMQPRSTTNQQLDVHFHMLGMGLHHVYRGAQWQWNSRLSWERRRDNYGSRRDQSLNDAEWGAYTLHSYQLAIHAFNEQRRHLRLEAAHSSGNDRNTYTVSPLVPALNAQNYRYRSSSLEAAYGLAGPAGKALQPGWGAALQWRQTSRRDFVTVHELRYAYITPSVYGALYSSGLPQGNRFHLQLQAGMRWPVSQSVTVLPTQQTDFSLDVVYHDYYYWSAKAALLQLDAQYTCGSMIPKVPAGIRLQLGYSHLLQEPDITVPGVREVGRRRVQGALSFHLYL